MVGLGQEREAVPLQPLNQPKLPERLGAVELLREDAPGEAAQLILGAGGGQRRVAHVVGEVEGWVVDPEGPSGLQSWEGELLPEAWHQVEARANVVEEVLVARRRAFEDEHRAHVHVAGRGLVGQKRGVDRAEPIHVRLLAHFRLLPYRRRACRLVDSTPRYPLRRCLLRPPGPPSRRPRREFCSRPRAATARGSTVPCRRSNRRSTSTGRRSTCARRSSTTSTWSRS